jgi:signal transduction histidine kinase
MNLIKLLATALVTSLLAVGAGAGEERGTKEEAIALTNAAYDHIKQVGPAKAYDDFTHDKAAWTKKDLYVMAYDGKAVCLAHGANEKLVGKDLTAVKDANGKPVVLGLLDTAAKGGGWFDYDWPHPVSKKIEPKSTYARKLPSGEGFVAVGIYR